MREVLRFIGIPAKSPLERARTRASNELSKVQLKTQRERDYWYPYEALAGVIQTRGIREEVLKERGAKPRKGLKFRDIENAVSIHAVNDSHMIEVTFTARKLQEVVKFTRKGRRMFPKTLENEPNL